MHTGKGFLNLFIGKTGILTNRNTKNFADSIETLLMMMMKWQKN
jgi:hypothetical protein